MDGSKEIDIILVLGTGGMLLLAFFIVGFIVIYQRRLYSKQKEINQLEMGIQKQLMEAVILTKEKEQKRVAQELHDGIGSALTALKLSLIQMQLSSEHKQWIDESLKSISTDVRRISNELMPSVLENMGLQTAIEKLMTNLNQSSRIEFSYNATEKWLGNLNEQGELALYRVVQEVLTNIVKYANASSVRITESCSENAYLLEIADNGKGFIPSEKDLTKPGSLGLKNIRSRIQQVNGRISYLPNAPKGTIVTIEIPIHEKN